MKAEKAMARESTYIRDGTEINRLRSGMGVDCEYCGAAAGKPCLNMRDSDGPTLLYCHLERRKAGKAAADALVIARGKARNG